VSELKKRDSAEHPPIGPLTKIIKGNQVWGRMAAKYGVDNPAPPWQTSLDGICDALDQSGCSASLLTVDRRNDEDELSATIYSGLPYPESRLVALAHSLIRRGLIDEAELAQRLATVRARLEA
jgi:hypothetical protein